MKAAVLMAVCLAALLAGIASIAAPLPVPSLITAACLAAISLIPHLNRPTAPGRLQPGKVFSLLAIFILLSGLDVDPSKGVEGWWPLSLAGLSLLAGLAMARRSWTEGGWTSGRTELTMAVGVGLISIGAMLALAWGILALRSTAGMQAGQVEYLDELAVWGAVWFGLDARLRLGAKTVVSSPMEWFGRHWLSLFCLIAAGVNLVCGV
jgi:hypothetical protein